MPRRGPPVTSVGPRPARSPWRWHRSTWAQGGQATEEGTGAGRPRERGGRQARMGGAFLPGAGRAADVAASPDGARVFVAGTVEQKGDFGDIETVAYDAANGNELWAARYDGPAGGEDRAEAIVVSPDGSTVYTAGMATSSTFQD